MKDILLGLSCHLSQKNLFKRGNEHVLIVLVGAGMGVVSVGPMVNMQATATIAKELLKSGNSPTAEAMVKQSLPPAPQGSLQVGLQQSVACT